MFTLLRHYGKEKVFGILVISIVSLIVITFTPGCAKKPATLSGTVVDMNGNPVYGATIEIGSYTVETSKDGEFIVENIPAGSHTITINAYGYYDYSEQIPLASGENNIGVISLTSKNQHLLSEIGDVSNYNGVKNTIDYMGFKVANDTSVSKAFTDAHINGMVNLISYNKEVTLGQIAEDLAVQGVKLNGSSITPSLFVEVLQASVEAAYQRPDDPRMLLPLYIVALNDGSLPSDIPILTTSTSLNPTKATILYTAIMYLSEHPISSISVSKSVNIIKGDKGLVEEILSSLSFYPIPPDPDDYDSFYEYFGAGTAQLLGSYAGSLVGLYIGYAIAGGLTYATGGVSAAFIPVIVRGTSIACGWLGGKIALWIYKSTWNRIGEAISEDEADGLVLDENGDIGFAADIRVTLTWDGGPLTDVDLHVTDPNGEECDYTNMTTAIGGELDVDDVDGYGPENFTLSRGEAIDGDYLIEVNYYDDEGTPGEPIDAKIVVHLNEGTPDEIVQEYGPHTITEADHNGTDPAAWWTVGTIHWPTGKFVKVSPKIKRKPLPSK